MASDLPERLRYRFTLIAFFLLLFPALPPCSQAYDILFSPWGESEHNDFGGTVCGTGDVDGNGVPDFLISETGYDDPGQFNAGRAWLYLCERSPFSVTKVLLESHSDRGLFGKEMAAIGDWNGDGYADFAINSENLYRTHLYLGGSTPEEIQEIIIPAPPGVRTLGVGAVGDSNGDGYDDFMIGTVGTGEAYLYLGGPNADTTIDFTFRNSTPAQATFFGAYMGSVGDFDGDGFEDFAIGIYGAYVDGELHPGVAFYRGGSVIDTEPDYVIEREGGTGVFGYAVSLTGDRTGDGASELLIDFYDHSVEGGAQRAALVYTFIPEHGFFQVGRIGGTPEMSVENFFGQADLDGDGLEDIVMGVKTGGTYPLEAWVLSGSSISFGPPYTKLPQVLEPSIYSGSIDTVGDITGDGIPELLIGAPGDDSRYSGAGRAYLLRGGGMRMLRLRAGQTVSPTGEEIVVPIMVSVDTDLDASPTTLASLDLELLYDSSVLEFGSAVLAHPSGEWLLAASDRGTYIDIAMAGLPAPVLSNSEDLLLELHFTLGMEPKGTRFELRSGQAMAQYDLPIWFTFESGWIGATDATDVAFARPREELRAYPNPFNPRTTLILTAPTAGPAELRIFDVRGRRVWSQDIEHLEPGPHRLPWEARDDEGVELASGVYFARATGIGWNTRTRLVLVR